jgi:hypothetical protein
VLAALTFSPAVWPMVLELIRASSVSRCLVRARYCCTAQTKPALPAVEAPRAMFRWPADGPPGTGIHNTPQSGGGSMLHCNCEVQRNSTIGSPAMAASFAMGRRVIRTPLLT